MAYDKAAFGYAVGVEFEHSDLPVHLFNRLGRTLEIIRRVRIFSRKSRVGIFEIGQIYINKTLQHFERFHGFISAAVIHNRHRRMIFFKYPRYGIRIMSRGNEIEIMRALFNEPVKSAHNIFVAHRDARSPAAYLAVLAIHAPEIAPAEEHCA